MQGNKFLSIEDFKPFDQEDAVVLFHEIDIDNGGTLSLDEVFYWLVNQMVGLQYNYRTQINKHLRKAYKNVDDNGDGTIQQDEFYLLMQYLGYYYRIFRKFADTPDNVWYLEVDQFKKHDLKKWVEGANTEEKWKRVTHGKTDKATFTHFIEYGTDLITRLTKQMRVVKKVEPVHDNSEEVLRLKNEIRDLKEKIKNLERENQKLRNELEALKQFEEECKNLRGVNESLRSQNENLRNELQRTAGEYQARITDLDNQLLSGNKKLTDLTKEFNKYKQDSSNELNKTKQDLGNQIKELTLKLAKSQEENTLKSQALSKQAAEVDNLNKLRAELEKSLREVKSSSDNSYKEHVAYKKNFEQKLDEFNANILVRDKRINDLNALLNQQLHKQQQQETEIIQAKNEITNSHNLSQQLESRLNDLMNQFKNSERIQKENKFKSANLETELRDLKVESESLRHSLQQEQTQNVNVLNALKESQAANINLKEKINLLTNELNKQHSDLDTNQELKEMYAKKLQRVNSDLSTQESLNESLKQETRKVQSDFNVVNKENKVLGLRVDELEARSYEELLDQYKDLISNYSNDMHVLKEDLEKASLRFREALNYTDTPAWKEVVETMSNKDKLLDNLKERNSKVSVDYLNSNNQVNTLNNNLQDYSKVQKILADLQKENNNLRPKFQELVLFKVNADRKIHELREEIIKAEVGENSGNYASNTSGTGSPIKDKGRLDEYKSKISELEDQLHTYKSRERDMSSKLDKFRGELDMANHKMSGIRNNNIVNSNFGQNEELQYSSLDSNVKTQDYKNDDRSQFKSGSDYYAEYSSSKKPTVNRGDHIKDLVSSQYDSRKISTKKEEDSDLYVNSLSNLDQRQQLFTRGYENKDTGSKLSLEKAVEDYSNNHDLKFNFKRFADGVYIYGSKCVTLRIDEGQLMAKVGGGWMHIDTFIET